jgi:hypothetical protein
MVTDTGETWGYKQDLSASVVVLTVLYHGQQSINGSSVSGSYQEYNLPGTGGAPTTTSYTGTAQAQNHLNLILGNGSTFNYSYDNSTAPTATLASLQGTWAGLLGNNLPGTAWQPDTLAVSGNSVSVPFPMGTSACKLTGTITQPLEESLDTYLFSGNFGSQCGVIGGVQIGGAALTGIISSDPPSVTGINQSALALFAVTTDKQVAMIFMGYQ